MLRRLERPRLLRPLPEPARGRPGGAARGTAGCRRRSRRSARCPASAPTPPVRWPPSPSRCRLRRWTGTWPGCWRASSRLEASRPSGAGAGAALGAGPGAGGRASAGRAAAGRARQAPPEPGDWNQALMELGATVCGRSPACGRCPLAPLCRRARRRAGAAPSRARGGGRPGAALTPRLRRGGAAGERAPRAPAAGRPLRGLLAPSLRRGVAGAAPRPAPGAPAGARRCGVRVRRAEVGGVERTLTHRDLRLRAHRCALLRRGGRAPAAELVLDPRGRAASGRAAGGRAGAAGGAPGRPAPRRRGRDRPGNEREVRGSPSPRG